MGELATEIEFLKFSDARWRRNLWWRIHNRGRAISNPNRDWSKRRKSTDGDTPKMLPDYEYHRLPSLRSIRVLRPIYVDEKYKFIFASLLTRDLDDSDPYLALSYTWGPAATPPEQSNVHDRFSAQYLLYVVDQSDLDDIVYDNVRTPDLPNPGLCDDYVVFKITLSENLSDFLVDYLDHAATFRYSEGTCDIWIDAVCINQKDSAEKSNQMQLMGDIYRNAKGVLVWLGNQTEGLEAFKWMNDAVFGALDGKKPDGEEWETFFSHLKTHNPTDANFWLDFLGLEPKGGDWLQIWDQFLRFIQRKRWFRRCWILQEYALAKGVLYLCGKTIVTDNIQLLGYSKDWIMHLEDQQDQTYGLGPTLDLLSLAIEHIRPFASEPSCFLTYFSDQSTGSSPIQMAMNYLTGLLQWTRERECAFDVDRVFSVLGIVCWLLGPSEILYPGVEGMFDRGSPAEVFTWVATVDAEFSPFLNLLSKIEPRGDRRLENLPSWVPDFSVGIGILPVSHTGCNAALMKSKLMKKPQVHGSTLTLNGQCIDVVVESYPACLGSAVLSISSDLLGSLIALAFEGSETILNEMSREDALESIFSGMTVMRRIFKTEGRLTKDGESMTENILKRLKQTRRLWTSS